MKNNPAIEQEAYFWFSKKQFEDRRNRIDLDKPRFDSFVTVDGVERQFTEQTISPQPSGQWDDYVLLGTATHQSTRHIPAAR